MILFVVAYFENKKYQIKKPIPTTIRTPQMIQRAKSQPDILVVVLELELLVVVPSVGRFPR